MWTLLDVRPVVALRVVPPYGLKLLRQNFPGQLSSSCEELPVNKAISRVHMSFGLRHRSLVGMCERMLSKIFFG